MNGTEPFAGSDTVVVLESPPEPNEPAPVSTLSFGECGAPYCDSSRVGDFQIGVPAGAATVLTFISISPSVVCFGMYSMSGKPSPYLCVNTRGPPGTSTNCGQ